MKDIKQGDVITISGITEEDPNEKGKRRLKRFVYGEPYTSENGVTMAVLQSKDDKEQELSDNSAP